MAISFYSEWAASGGANGSVTITGSANPSGSLIIVPVTLRTRDTDLELAISDDAGNTYHLLPQDGSYNDYSWLYYTAGAAPTSSITVISNKPDIYMNVGVYVYTGVDSTNPVEEANHAMHPNAMAYPPVEVTPSAGSLVFGLFAAGVTNRLFEQLDPGYELLTEQRKSQLTTQVVSMISGGEGQTTGPHWQIVPGSGSSSGASAITVAFRADENGGSGDPGGSDDPEDPVDVGLDVVAVSGWSSVTGGTRLAVANSDDDASYISTAANPQQEELIITLPPIESPQDDLEMPLRLSVSGGKLELDVEAYNPSSSTWIPAQVINVASSQPSYYTAIWPLSTIGGFSAEDWNGGINVRLRATGGVQPLFHQVTSSGVKPIFLGIVGQSGVDVGSVSTAAVARLHRASILAVAADSGPGSDPDPDPTPPEPATIDHGSELPATSWEAEQVIGAQGQLTEWEGSTTLTGTQVIENRSFTNKNIRIADGADVTLRNCLIVGPPASTNYAVRINEGTSKLLMENCTVVNRSVANEGTGSHAVSGWGNTSLALRRCVIRGGIDGIHYHGNGAAIWPTGDPLVPMATFLMEECWIGDNERYADSHSDLFQMAGARPNPVRNFVFRRNRFMGYSLERGADALTNRADPATSGMASACYMDSTGDKGYGRGSALVAIRDNWFEGGNWMLNLGYDPSPDVSSITDNLFAPKANFGAIQNGGTWDNRNNRWAYSGELGNGTQVVGGELVSGSSE